MRYGLHLLPDAFLLLALLRMTFVHVHRERPAMFFFLAAWLVYSLVALFLAQVHPASSPEYADRFAWLTLAAWICAGPALWLASARLAHSPARFLAIAAVLCLAAWETRQIFESTADCYLAGILALNSWMAVLAGTIFLGASSGAEAPDGLLWRAAGSFFLLYGAGYLAIGALRPGAWAYCAFVLALAAVWFVLAWRIGVNGEPLFNLEKLGFIPGLMPRTGQVLAKVRHG